MRICRVTRRLPPLPGGQEIHVYELTRRQVARGHEVDLWFSEGADVPEGARAHRVAATILGRPLSGTAASAAYSWRAARGIRRAPAPHLVHVHGDYPEAWFGTRCATAHDVPIVMTVHAGLNLCHLRLSRRGMRGVRHFIGLGTRVADDLLACGVPHDRITVMSSGLDWELLDARLTRSERAAGPPMVISVGALDRMKNHETVLAAARLAREVHPDLEVVIVGEGPERPHLEAVAADENVRFTGQLARPDVYSLVSRASVFVLASRRLSSKGEGVPSALLEAMGLGRPCIVSNDCTPDAIAARDSGAYIAADPTRPREFADGILRVLGDAEVATEMSKCAAAAVASLGWDNIVSRVEDVYEAVLGAP
jgi:glycosyltransferase involved in cell wall biosynthesis